MTTQTESGIIEVDEIGLQEPLAYTYNGEESYIPNNAVINSVHTIAGNGSETSLKVAEKLSAEYGGNVSEWSKKVGKVESDKYTFDVHWYELDGKQYNAKVKYRGDKK